MCFKKDRGYRGRGTVYGICPVWSNDVKGFKAQEHYLIFICVVKFRGNADLYGACGGWRFTNDYLVIQKKPLTFIRKRCLQLFFLSL